MRRRNKLAAFLAVTLAAIAGAQVVQWEFVRRQRPGRCFLSRDASSVDSKVSNKDGAYFAIVTVGTPGQQLSLQLDTGSSDVWLPYSGAESCQAKSPNGDSNCTMGSCKQKQAQEPLM